MEHKNPGPCTPSQTIQHLPDLPHPGCGEREDQSGSTVVTGIR